MKCGEMEFLISLHADNRLNDAEIAELLEHFEECPGCRQTYKDFLDLKSLLASGNNITVSPDFENKVMAKIKNSDKSAPARIIYPNFKKRIITAAAGFLFIVISSAALFTVVKIKKSHIAYDFSWYYDIGQETAYESSSTNSIESFILNV